MSTLLASDENWQHVVRLGTEPMSGQMYGITDEDEIVAEPSCYGVTIPNIGEAKKLDLENNHGVLLRNDGIVVSFAPQSAYDALESTPIIFNYQVEDVAAGFDFNVAVDGTQNVLYWGVPHSEAQYGYLDLPYAGQFVEIDAFGLTVAALTSHGEVLVWGEDAGGVVTEAPAAYQEAAQIALGDGFAVMLRNDGTVVQWGDGSGSAINMPSPPLGLSNVVELATSSNQVAAYLSDGSIVHWGISPSVEDVMGLEYTASSELVVVTEFCVPGCTNPAYVNYDSLATIDDGTCANTGCTDETALNYDPWADTEDDSCLLIGCSDIEACNYNAAASISLRIETVAVHEGVVGSTDLTGYVTYRLYLETPGTDDILIFAGGQDSDPLMISTTTSFWQHPLSSVLPSLSPIWLTFSPDLSFDSWVTIGATNETYNESEPISTIASPHQDWVSIFEGGDFLVADDFIGGGWFGWPTHANSVVGSDGEILIAQLTTDGELNVESLFAQIWQNGDPNQALSFNYSGSLHGCTYPQSTFADCDGCFNDTDEDGICDGDEIVGCTNADACNYNAEATDDDGSCRLSSEDISLNLELHATHTSGELEGYNTYRLYAHLTQPEDKLDAVYGTYDNPLIIDGSIGDFYHHPYGSYEAVFFPQNMIDLDPLRAYDSYVTLGWDHTEPSGYLESIESSENPWTSNFELGQAITIDNLAGGGWYTMNNNNNSLSDAGEDLQVLLGQFTTLGGLSGMINIQAEGCGSVGTYNALSIEFSSQDDLNGCTDSEACNYTPTANVDNGTCCYDNCIQGNAYLIDELQIINLIDNTIQDFEVVGNTFSACLSDGCYVIQGADEVYYNGSPMSVMVNSDYIIDSSTYNCVGCTDPYACNYNDAVYYDNQSCEYLIGDLDNDQFVGINDILILLSQYASCLPEDNCVADVDNDGFVALSDVLIMLSAYDTGCPD
jgi:hypothetical protein